MDGAEPSNPAPRALGGDNGANRIHPRLEGIRNLFARLDGPKENLPLIYDARFIREPSGQFANPIPYSHFEKSLRNGGQDLQVVSEEHSTTDQNASGLNAVVQGQEAETVEENGNIQENPGAYQDDPVEFIGASDEDQEIGTDSEMIDAFYCNGMVSNDEPFGDGEDDFNRSMDSLIFELWNLRFGRDLFAPSELDLGRLNARSPAGF